MTRVAETGIILRIPGSMYHNHLWINTELL